MAMWENINDKQNHWSCFAVPELSERKTDFIQMPMWDNVKIYRITEAILQFLSYYGENYMKEVEKLLVSHWCLLGAIMIQGKVML